MGNFGENVFSARWKSNDSKRQIHARVWIHRLLCQLTENESNDNNVVFGIGIKQSDLEGIENKPQECLT